MNNHDLARQIAAAVEAMGSEDVSYTLTLPSGAYATVTVVVTQQDGEEQ